MRWRTSWYTSRRRASRRRTPRRAGRRTARRRSSRRRAAPLAARTSGRRSSRRRAPRRRTARRRTARRRTAGRGPTRWSPHGVLWLSRRRRSGQLSRRRRSDGPGQPWLARLLSAGQPSRSQRNSGHGRLRSSRDRTKFVQAATTACPGVRAEKLSSQRLSCQSKLALPPPEKRANEACHSSLLRARRGGRVQAESGGRKPDLTKALKSEAMLCDAAPAPLALLP